MTRKRQGTASHATAKPGYGDAEARCLARPTLGGILDSAAQRIWATQQLAQLLNNEDAQRHLMAYGWVEGMPVIFADPQDQVEEIMGFASVHGRAVLLAIGIPECNELQLWHITIPSPIFDRVPPLPSGTTLGQLCIKQAQNRLRSFRVSFWAHSAAIHEIPCFVRNDESPLSKLTTKSDS